MILIKDMCPFIPLYGPAHNVVLKRLAGTIIFGADGGVKDYRWNMSDAGTVLFSTIQ